MLGITKWGLVVMIFVQTLFFIIPAFTLAFSTWFLILFGLDNILYKFLQTHISIVPSWVAILIAILIGILVPVLAAIIPISHAFKQGLNISLDMNHSKTQGVQISI